MLTYILLLGLAWLAEIAWLALDLELSLRVLAAGALVLHPWHEQRKGFRGAFNMAVRGEPERTTRDLRTTGRRLSVVGPLASGPLSRTMNVLQTAGLVTVFPALALWGPWWAVMGMFAFYVGDVTYTHRDHGVPGEWSAWCGLAALGVLYSALHESPITVQSGVVAATATAAGLLLLALPWVMAYRRVRS